MRSISFSIALTLCGCSQTPKGIIEPHPQGCIHLEFYSDSDTSVIKQGETGEITHVVTPTNRTEPVIQKWEKKDFQRAVDERDPDWILSKSSGLALLEFERRQEHLCIPGKEAWSIASKNIKRDDEIWTFGGLDFGTVIIRDSRLICMIVTNHQF